MQFFNKIVSIMVSLWKIHVIVEDYLMAERENSTMMACYQKPSYIGLDQGNNHRLQFAVHR